MKLNPRQSPATGPISWRLLLRAALVVAALGAGGEVMASSVSASAGASSFDAEAHDANCVCGQHCRQQACCCGHRKSVPVPQVAPAAPDDADAGSTSRNSDVAPGPCMGRIPCGDPFLPDAPSSSSTAVGKSATLLALCGWDLAELPARRLLAQSARLVPSWRADRLDDPPERPAAA